MRLRYLFCSTILLTCTWSCRSSSQPSESTAPEGGETPQTAWSEAEGLAIDRLRRVSAPTGQDPTEASAPLSTQDQLAQDAERLKRIRERQEFLSGAYIKRGNELIEQADLEGALGQFAQALEVMPSSQAARDGMRRVEALMGSGYAQASEFFEDAVSREAVRRAQARLSAEQASSKGDDALRAGNYQAAVDAYREAQIILRYHPLIATQSLDEQIVTGKLNDAIRMRDQAVSTAAARKQQQAEAAKAAREREQAAYRENQLRTLYSRANDDFNRENYASSEALAEQILMEDPGNETALKMRNVARMARHDKTNATTRRDYREQWRRTIDELDTMDVPQTNTLVYDMRRWAEVSGREPLEFTASRAGENAETRAVRARLESVLFPVRFVGPDGTGSPLTEIAAFLQNLTGVNFLISQNVKFDLDEEETTILLDLPERSVKNVLELIADTSENLRWKIEDGVVKFVTKEELVGGQILAMYEVRDLIHPVPNFSGREINVSPSGGLEQPDEDYEEREGLVVTSDALESLIRDNIDPESWNEDPRNALRIADNGTMVVFQTPEVQEKIRGLLDDLREATGIMVDIQARFLTVEDNFLEDIGVDFRGLGQPGLGTNNFLNDFGDASTQGDLGAEIGQGSDLGAFLDEGEDGDIRGRTENLYDLALGDADVLTGSGGLSFQWAYLNDLELQAVLRAVSKSERVELVTAPRLLVFNTARANIAVLNQVAYVQDFDVEIAQAASIADPIINVVQDGVVLDVRPVVSADRRFILMELRPTVATLTRPIREQATTLGSQNSVTIQLPEVDIQRVRTTVPMPDGGTVLLGGLKVSEKQDLRSGIPIVNKIPIVRFLFERKGQYVTNRKLLILLRANIVITQEQEPTPSQLGLGAPRSE
jgi:type II secretory pathway component GspD/PulD (secretin)